MATIVSPAAYVAAVAALLLSGIGVGLPIDSAGADDNCASAPGAAAPAGQHWYYRIDRVKQRKCWYLHAAMALPTHAAAKHPAEPSEPGAAAAAPQLPFAATPQLPYAAPPEATNAASASRPPADNSNTPGEAAGSQPEPHVTVLAVKPVSALFDDTTSAPQAATPEQASEPPMRQIAANNANAPANAEPAGGVNLASAPGATDTDQHGVAPADAAATVSARTQSADLFFLLALALGIAAALLALCSKMAGRTRAPLLSEHPDDAWRRIVREEDAPLLAPAEPNGPADLDAYRRTERSPPGQADFPAARPRGKKPRQSEQVGPDLKDIELALRVLRQARQSVTQT
jgi:hypothetical protein